MQRICQRWIKFFSVLLMGALSTAAVAGAVTTPEPVSGRGLSTAQKIIPADVLARSILISDELELLRKTLGKDKRHKQFLVIRDAEPREVFYQAETVFEKANRLAFEITGSYVSAPKIDETNIQPKDVWVLLDASLQRIFLVKESLNIKEFIEEKEQPVGTEPSDVFESLLSLNVELNRLLQNQISPSDVYEQITLAVNYAGFLLEHVGAAPYIPEAPEYIKYKTPLDVYKRLIESIQLLKKISEVSGMKMLDIGVSEGAIYQAEASDVFDLSKIIVSEVKFFNSLIGNIEPISAFYPGYKVPSDVYQRSGILLKQLEALYQSASNDKNWLSQRKEDEEGA